MTETVFTAIGSEADVQPASTELDLRRLADEVGRTAVSEWIDVTQQTIERFADATGDDQWVHVDCDRARAESPYGCPIAQGFLTLALVSRLMRRAVRFTRAPRLSINCGLNRVRFHAPLPAGSRVRGRFELRQVEALDDALHTTWSVTVEREGSDRPCCAAEWLLRYYL